MNVSGPHNTAWKNISQTREKLEEAGKVAATAGDTVRPQEGGQQAWLPEAPRRGPAGLVTADSEQFTCFR